MNIQREAARVCREPPGSLDRGCGGAGAAGLCPLGLRGPASGRPTAGRRTPVFGRSSSHTKSRADCKRVASLSYEYFPGGPQRREACFIHGLMKKKLPPLVIGDMFNHAQKGRYFLHGEGLSSFHTCVPNGARTVTFLLEATAAAPSPLGPGLAPQPRSPRR